jgi:hypothetical protein
MNGVLQPAKLVHHLFVDSGDARPCRRSRRGLVRASRLRFRLCDLHDILRRSIGVDGHIQLPAERLELIDCGGTIYVCCDKSRWTSFTFQLARKASQR